MRLLKRFFAIIRGLDDKLYDACLSNNLDIVKYCIENGADVNYEKRPTIPVITASRRRYSDIVKYLINYGANIHCENDELLRFELTYKNVENVKFLIRNGANIHVCDDYILIWAIKIQDIELIEYLIFNNININTRNSEALYNAIIINNEEIINLLIKNGAKADTGCVLRAVKDSSLRVIKILEKNGADFSKIDKKDCSKQAWSYIKNKNKNKNNSFVKKENNKITIHDEFDFSDVDCKEEIKDLKKIIKKDYK